MPINETVMVCPLVPSILKLPSMSVTVFCLFSTIPTTAPTMGSPSVSVTEPVTHPFSCAMSLGKVYSMINRHSILLIAMDCIYTDFLIFILYIISDMPFYQSFHCIPP